MSSSGFSTLRERLPGELENQTNAVAQATNFFFFELGDTMKEADLLQEFALIAFVIGVIMFVLLAVVFVALRSSRLFSSKKVRKYGHSLLVQIVVGVMCGHAHLIFAGAQYLGFVGGPAYCSSSRALLLLHFSLLAGPTAFQLYVMWRKLRASNPLVQEPYQRIIWDRSSKSLSFCHALVSGALAIALIALAGVRGASAADDVTYPRTFCDEIRSSEAELYLIAAMWALAALPYLLSVFYVARVARSRFLPLWGKRWVKLRMQWLALWIALLWTFLTIFVESSFVRLMARVVSIQALTVASTWPLLADVVKKVHKRQRFGSGFFNTRFSYDALRHRTFLDNLIENLEEELEKYHDRRSKLEREMEDERARRALAMRPLLATRRVDVVRADAAEGSDEEAAGARGRSGGSGGGGGHGSTGGHLFARGAHVELRPDGRVAIYKRPPSASRREYADRAAAAASPTACTHGMSAGARITETVRALIHAPRLSRTRLFATVSGGEEKPLAVLELLECPAGQAEDDSSFLYEDSVVGAVAGEEAEPIEDDGAATLVVCARDANNRGESVSASGGGRRHYYALRFKSSRGHRGALLAQMWRRELRRTWKASGKDVGGGGTAGTKKRRSSLGSALFAPSSGQRHPAQRLTKSISSPADVEASSAESLKRRRTPSGGEGGAGDGRGGGSAWRDRSWDDADAPRNLDLFVGTWNVGGVRRPTDELEVTTADLRTWLRLPDASADEVSSSSSSSPPPPAASEVRSALARCLENSSVPSVSAAAAGVTRDSEASSSSYSELRWCDVYVVTFQELNTSPAKTGTALDEKSGRAFRHKRAGGGSRSARFSSIRSTDAKDDSHHGGGRYGGAGSGTSAPPPPAYQTMGDRLQAALGSMYEQLQVGEGTDGYGMSAKTVGGINKNRNLRSKRLPVCRAARQ